ncbi:MAG: RNA polymerase sigma-54 factor [Rhodothalassiaceae bacterium]|nr:MAG: RNA polymerase sigma-54 factor [Rhodothalassiaceae bacterium]
MAVGPRLQLKASQQLVLTPQLQQAIKLLQMPNLELAAYLQQQAEINPFLDLAAPPTEVGFAEEAAGGEAVLSGFEVSEGVYAADAGMDGSGMIEGAAAPLDADFEDNVFDDAPVDRAGVGRDGPAGGGRRDPWDDEGPDLDNLADRAGDLRGHLLAQLPLVVAEGRERFLAERLVDLVDERGYLTADLGELAGELGVEEAELEALRQRLTALEPTGVFARDLKECLALQLAERDRLDPAMEALIAHLDLLARRDMARLRRLCGVDAEDLMEMIREIKSLDPHPGLQFGAATAEPVVPDVIVRPLPKGGYAVELNEASLPRLIVDRRYYAEVRGHARGRREKRFLAQCWSDANWLVRALDQRARTILNVATAIVRRQENFFRIGVAGLRPMTLKDVADEIGMHESTVSRVTSQRFMATPRGVVSFKSFFTTAISTTSGDATLSAASVRARIRALIDAEDPNRVLSDDQIVKLLKKEGIDVARRTVAKYREAMGIPSSVERRRMKKLALT